MTHDDARASELIYDWNEVGRKGRLIPQNVDVLRRDLRDGLQNPSVKDPGIEHKLELLHLMDELGIHVADIGLPGQLEARLRRRAAHVQGGHRQQA
jgi:2-isopropylmalate synthase